MGVQHHGEEDLNRQMEFIKRFKEQAEEKYRRQFPDGRINAEDDGDLTYVITTDDRHRTIVIKFAHPTEWIGLNVQAATELRDQLTERILALRGITA